MSDAPDGGADTPSDNLTSTSDLPQGVQTVYAGAGNFAAVAQMFRRRRVAQFEVDRKDHVATRDVATPAPHFMPPRVLTDAQRGGTDVPRNLAAAQFSPANDPMKSFSPEKFDMGDHPRKPPPPDAPSSLDSRIRGSVVHGPADSTARSVRNSGIKAYKRAGN